MASVQSLTDKLLLMAALPIKSRPCTNIVVSDIED